MSIASIYDRRLCSAIAATTTFLVVNSTQAIDIQGVLPASLDQPRIYLAVLKDAKGPPLTAKSGGDGLAEALAAALGEKPKKGAGGDEDTGIFAIEAFLDTGASGIMLSKPTAESLGMKQISTGNEPVHFFDVGIGGEEPFAVTDAYYFRTHEGGGNSEGEDLDRYAPATAPIRPSYRVESGLMDQLTGGLDVAGMPVMAGKVMVIDARPLAKMDKLKTMLVSPGDKSIPAVDMTVALSYADFGRFTRTEPATAPRVTLAANPMIGPSPLDKSDKSTPVTINHQGKTTTLTMLLDTGAASSMISVGKAKALGITVDGDKLVGVDPKDQFTLPIGGIGGSKNVPGFFVDVLQLPVTKGEPIRYLRAPVLVLDISAADPKTGETVTLDGIFGMNYLVASATVSVGLTGGGIDDIHDGPFDVIVIDHAKRTMGMKLKR